MRIFRWLLWFVAAVVGLIAVGIAVLYATFDPNDYKQRIVDLVAERTGRTLHLDGAVSLSFFPWLGLRLEDVSLDNPPGFDNGSFASIGQLGLKVGVLPLIDGQLVADTLILDTVTLQLHRTQDGRDNWSGLFAREDATASDSDGKKDEAQTAWIQGFAVQGVELKNGKLQWRDELSGSRYSMEQVQLTTGSIAPGAAVPAELEMQFATHGDGMSGRMKASGDLALSEDFQRLEVPNLAVQLVSEGSGLPPGAAVKLTAGLSLDQSADRLALNDLRVEGPGGLSLSGNLTGESLTGEPEVQGALTLHPFNLRELLTQLNGRSPNTRDPNVLSAMQGEIGINANARSVTLKPLSLRLDDTTVNGEVAIALADPLSVTFSATGDVIDVDRYLSPESGEGTAAGEGAGSEGGKNGIALGLPNASGTLDIGTLRVSGMTLTNMHVAIKSANGELSFDPISAKLYSGDYVGSVKLRQQGKTVTWQANERLKGIQMGPFLTDLTGEDRLDGTGNLEARVNGTGLDDGAIRRSLQGHASFDFRNGALKGVNLAQVFRELKAKLKGRTLEGKEPLRTDFSELSGTLEFGKGEARNSDLLMKSPFIRVQGKGKADLVSEKLDYLLTTKVVGTAKGQGGQDLSDLDGVTVPVRVGGTLTEPIFEPDLEEAVKLLAGKRLDEEKAKLEEKAKTEIEKQAEKAGLKVTDDLDKTLRKFFK